MPDFLGPKSPLSSADHDGRSSRAIKQSEQNFYELIESLPMIAVQGYDRQRRVIYWNDASKCLYGYTREEAEGQLLEDLIIPDQMREGVIDAHQDWLHSNVSIPAEEVELKHKDGHPVPVYSSHVMIKQDTGDCEMFCIDISLQEQKKAKEKLQWMANFDDLTQLPNRRLMEAELSARLAEAERRPNSKVAVVFIDLDNFKMINDTLGHHYGDELLRAVAEGLKTEIRSCDQLSRFGGDEFVLLLFDFDGVEGIHELLQRIANTLDRGFVINGLCYQVSASFGVSLFPDDGKTIADLMGNADAAMYQAKDKGKNRVCFYTSDINDRLHHYQKIGALLRSALAADSLQLYFQPQIDLHDGSIRSCEALLRCFDNNALPVPPDIFIPVAEKSGLINRIGDWVIEAACKQLVAWKGTELEKLRIDINLSGKQLTNQHLADQILQTLHRYDLLPSQLGVELTENEVIGGDLEQIGQLETLKNAGVHISIDDFGTGYSSLVYLRRLPVCSLKIDRSFLHHAMENDSDMAIMQAIISVGHSFGLSVVVEGVETAEQDDLVKALSCDLAQGYLYARPMPAEAMPAYLLGVTGDRR
ncbi:putative bifunctional diguanylate cyclase/phosphodiesterase [Halopseudomonas salegens]|uniref:PAS domain S-box-containing protein/diguanylate cyclase (GGDEF) domain-containing protein n=1 Tax=Halopseudomonas salegens TaxID=1434072 RepID=A0A1H2G6V1_9GAMM|nr:EAL domain-containing protein [Halopseudomonas salegens]SDU15343.1 PAS domain S-box-containing protein/diguanylate cyclase (GGDEF) domain-containing protein [Halopseudomonas salegens]